MDKVYVFILGIAMLTAGIGLFVGGIWTNLQLPQDPLMEAYDRGYSDGYEKGYDDGFNERQNWSYIPEPIPVLFGSAIGWTSFLIFVTGFVLMMVGTTPSRED